MKTFQEFLDECTLHLEAYVSLRTSDQQYDEEGFPTTTRNWDRALTRARIAVGRQKFRGRTTGNANIAKGVAAVRRLEKMKEIDAVPESKRKKRSEGISQRNREIGEKKRNLETSLNRQSLEKAFKL